MPSSWRLYINSLAITVIAVGRKSGNLILSDTTSLLFSNETFIHGNENINKAEIRISEITSR